MRSLGNCQPVHPDLGRSIRAHARKLFRSGRVPGASQEDLEQELYAAFLPRNRKYDPQRSSYRTFVERVVANCAATLVEAAQAQKRGRQFDTVGFERLERESEDGEVLDAEDVIGWHRLRNGSMPRPEHDAIIVLDVRRVVRALPRHLRQTCAGLMVGTVSDTAQRCGVSSWAVHDRVKAIRAHFVAAGLDVYLTSTQDNPNDSGK